MVLLKRILAASLLICVLPLSVIAQSGTGGYLSVVSNPPGAEVSLNGDAVLTGITPVVFEHGLVGSFDLTVRKHGYETYSSRVILDPSTPLELNIDLTPRTRFKAGVRSAFIPGWGQWYGGQKGKGVLYLLAAAGAATAFFVADQDFDDKFATFEARRSEFDEAVASGAGYSELQTRLRALNAAQDDAYDAEDTRRIAIGVAVGVWALNVLDAVVFFPEERGVFSYKGVSLEPQTQGQTFGLALTTRF